MPFIKKHKNDIVLICAVLLLAGAFWAYSLLTREAGGEILVMVEGEERMRLSLAEDFVITVGEDGHTNLLVIAGGGARVTEASCPDHICVRQGEIRYDGEAIVCLPNKMVVSIVGGESSDVDAVTGGQ